MKTLILLLVSILLCGGTSWCDTARGKFQYDSKGKRDPFVPVEDRQQSRDAIGPVAAGLTASEKLNAKGIKVSSIVWSQNSPAILVGDSILEVGQSVKGVVIRAIEKDYVVFEVDGELVEVPLAG